jgi:hypothetical protein
MPLQLIHPFIHSILCTKCCPFIMLVHVHTSNYRHKPTVHLVIPRNFTIISNLWHSMTLWCFGWFFCFIWNVHMCVDIRLRYDRMIRYEIWEIDCIPNPKFFLMYAIPISGIPTVFVVIPHPHSSNLAHHLTARLRWDSFDSTTICAAGEKNNQARSVS